MKALYFDGKKLETREMEKPAPGPGEVLIRVTLAGVCRTDVEIVKGYMGFTGIPGHEFVGLVRESEDKSWIGKRVVGEINLPCTECSFCGGGLSRHCPNRQTLGIYKKDGAFAEYVTLPLSNLHEVPDDLSDEAAVFVEPAAACFEILEQTSVRDKRVLVLGDGKLGILVARVLKGQGVKRLVLAGKHPDKMALLEKDKIETAPVGDVVKTIAPDPFARFDMVVEATGRPDGFETAMSLVRPRGEILQKTTAADRVPADLSRLVVDEISVIGSRCGPFPPALSALASGEIKTGDLIGGAFPLEDGAEAVKEASRPGALKILIRVGEE